MCLPPWHCSLLLAPHYVATFGPSASSNRNHLLVPLWLNSASFGTLFLSLPARGGCPPHNALSLEPGLAASSRWPGVDMFARSTFSSETIVRLLHAGPHSVGRGACHRADISSVLTHQLCVVSSGLGDWYMPHMIGCLVVYSRLARRGSAALLTARSSALCCGPSSLVVCHCPLHPVRSYPVPSPDILPRLSIHRTFMPTPSLPLHIRATLQTLFLALFQVPIRLLSSSLRFTHADARTPFYSHSTPSRALPRSSNRRRRRRRPRRRRPVGRRRRLLRLRMPERCL